MLSGEISNTRILAISSQLDEKNRYLYDFIDNSWGDGREGVGNDTETLVSEKNERQF
jgi:hypothetical protein